MTVCDVLGTNGLGSPVDGSGRRHGLFCRRRGLLRRCGFLQVRPRPAASAAGVSAGRRVSRGSGVSDAGGGGCLARFRPAVQPLRLSGPRSPSPWAWLRRPRPPQAAVPACRHSPARRRSCRHASCRPPCLETPSRTRCERRGFVSQHRASEGPIALMGFQRGRVVEALDRGDLAPDDAVKVRTDRAPPPFLKA